MELIIDFPGGSRVDAHFGPFTVQTDQPPEASAPSPFDVFLSSIGTCAGIYVLGFAASGGFPRMALRSLNELPEIQQAGWSRKSTLRSNYLRAFRKSIARL